MSIVVWHGNQQEAFDLIGAVTQHCTCGYHPRTGDLVFQCEPHRMVNEDQRALDRLLFARRIAVRLQREEFGDRPQVT
jgi:hypothetical protein